MREIKHALTSEPKRVNAGKLILKFLATLRVLSSSRDSLATKLRNARDGDPPDIS